MEKWAYLKDLYKHFCDSAINMTNYQNISPDRFEKFTNVSLVVNVFNEKTLDSLKIHE